MMVDLHTHILPGMDDGAKNSTMSIEMLKLEAEQGIDTVVFTPHFYRERENVQHFLKRRDKAHKELLQAIENLGQASAEKLPDFMLGAEVTWFPNLSECDELDKLCYEGTRYILIEPPMQPWDDRMFAQLYDMISKTGMTPVIAHIDRYWGSQKQGAIDDMLSLGVPVQLSAEMLLHFSSRGKALKYIKNESASLIISDCHNVSGRRPNTGDAMQIIEKKLGRRTAALLRENSAEIIKAE